MKTIGITGGTGFIGRHITGLLVSAGYRVVIFTRSQGKKAENNITYAHWDVENKICDTGALGDLVAVINLAGAGIADKRLTERRKKEIIDSRVNGTAFILSNLKEYAPNCKTLISASAIGYYGPDRPGQIPFTETAPPFDDFLGTTCRLWEEAALKTAPFFRTVIIRIGIVLGKDGGAYPRLARPLSFGIMPILGSGRQVVSWIAIDDLARLFLYALEHNEMSGIFNGVAPAPVTHKQLMHIIKKAKHSLGIPIPVPAFALKLLLGEMSGEVLKSATVSCEKALRSGFTFKYPDAISAIKSLESK